VSKLARQHRHHHDTFDDHHASADNITFIRGSPNLKKDLRKCDVRKAIAVVLLGGLEYGPDHGRWW